MSLRSQKRLVRLWVGVCLLGGLVGLAAGQESGSLEFWLPYLDHEVPEVRREAAGQLREFPGAVPALLEHLSDADAKVRYEVAKSLGLIGAARAFDPLAARLQVEENGRVRSAILEALVEIEPEAALEHVEARLKSPSWNEQREAVRSLREYPLDVRMSAYETLIDDSDSDFAEEILAGYIKGAGPNEIPRLVDLLEKYLERNSALFSLIPELDEHHGLEALRLAAQSSQAQLRAAVASRLGSEYRGGKAEALLKGLALDPDPLVRLRALSAQSRLAAIRKLPGTADWISEVQPYLRYPEPAVRGEATGTLWFHDDEGATDALIELLDDEDRSVRMNAAWILAQRKDDRCVPALRDYLERSQAFGERQGAAAAMRALTDDPHPGWVRIEALPFQAELGFHNVRRKRELYVWMPEESFNRTNLKRLYRYLADEFPAPSVLTVYVRISKAQIEGTRDYRGLDNINARISPEASIRMAVDLSQLPPTRTSEYLRTDHREGASIWENGREREFITFGSKRIPQLLRLNW